MYKVQEYIVFYLRVESPWRYEDLVSIGVREESWNNELTHQKELIDAVAAMIDRWHTDLMNIESYAMGIGSSRVTIQHFGPCLLFYLPNQNCESTKAMYALAAIGLPRILRKLGMKCRFVRGAFVHGYGWEIEEDGLHTLYGPVMQKAWKMMVELAYSPRIIIEQEIFNVVSARSSYGSGPDGDWLPIYARRDIDGLGIFDYLAKDLTSPAVRYDTVNVVVAEMKTTLRILIKVLERLASKYAEHDNSLSVRMSLAVSDYLQESICKWTGQSKKAILDEVMRAE